ncbi:MAG: hypothetical protein V3571_07265, partial [Pseudodesulfovibrio sp.]
MISVRALDYLGRSTIQNKIATLVDTLKMQNDITLEKLESDLGLMDKEVEVRGGFRLDADAPVPTTMINQISKETDSAAIPS